jgi:hypothetical protein
MLYEAEVAVFFWDKYKTNKFSVGRMSVLKF